MKFIKPVQIADAEFVSSTVAETDHAAWSSGTTYAVGDKVIKITTHRIYESVQAGNTNHDPATDDGTWWIDIGPTNRWAMFDRTVGTVTTDASAPLDVVIAPGIINSLALLDLSGTAVTISMTDGVAGPTVYDQTYTLGDTAELFDWYDYFFTPIVPKTSLIVRDLPPYADGQITVSIAGVTAAACGTLSVGTTVDIGRTRYGAGVGILDYSRKETDVFGVTTVLERAFAKRIEVSVLTDNIRLDYLARQLASVRATPCVWAADNNAGYESLIAYGFYKDWRITIPYPNQSEISMTIEGLT